MAMTEDRVALIKRRYAEGASLSEIAAEIQGTRGMVSGKIHRLGLRRDVVRIANRKGGRKSKIKPPPTQHGTEFMDTTGCRHPIDHGGTLFCNAPIHRCSYCEYHYDLNYQRVRPIRVAYHRFRFA